MLSKLWGFNNWFRDGDKAQTNGEGCRPSVTDTGLIVCRFQPIGAPASSPVGSTNHRQAGESSAVGRAGLGIAWKQDRDSAVVHKMLHLYDSLSPLAGPLDYSPDLEIDFSVRVMRSICLYILMCIQQVYKSNNLYKPTVISLHPSLLNILISIF